MERFTHPKPIKPQAVVDLELIRRAEASKLRAGLADLGPGLASLAGITASMYAGSLMEALTEEEREQVRQYNREVDAYNAAVDEYNRKVRAARNARRDAQAAARRTAQVRVARCDKCFTVHGAGQVECW